MPDTSPEFGSRSFTARLAETIRESRRMIGWSQDELARRASTSQATISRLESARASTMDLRAVERALAALGIRASLELGDRHLADRRRQRDGVHARLNGSVARRLERVNWLTATEVQVGEAAPRGWIDLLAFRPADRSLLVEETKGDILDAGGMQRSLAFYAREAPMAARRLGWHPARTRVLLVALDSAAVARRLLDNRDLLLRAFPAPVEMMDAWLADPARPAPPGWVIGMADPASRATTWLRPTPLTARRRTFTYVDYADAARQLLGSQDATGRCDSRSSTWG